MKAVRTLALAVTLMAGAVGAQASLVNRGGGMIYDTELNVTWLQNWNQAVGSAYDTASPGTGRMTWGDAKAWADTLVFGGFDDWRLPTMLDTGVAGCDYREAGGIDCGFNVQTKSGATVYSEMAHLWYETLGNLAYFTPGTGFSPQAGYGLTHFGPFANLKSGGYWSYLEYLPVAGRAWAFGTVVGNQVSDLQDHVLYAMAVCSGDVAAALPEPHASVLALTALGALAFVRRRRPR